MIIQQVISDPPCSIGESSGVAIASGWTVVEEYEPCPVSMNPRGEWAYYIVLPSGIQIPITCENYMKLAKPEYEYPGCNAR